MAINDKSDAENLRELTRAVDNSQQVLIAATTVWPLKPFPATITVDRVKVTVTTKVFFADKEVVSIQIEDILNVEVDIHLFLGALKLFTRFYNNEPVTIDYLRRDDAIAVKRVLQGYIIAIQKGIDCSAMDKNKLVPMLHKLGQHPTK